MGVTVTELVDSKKCAKCQGKLRFWQKKGFDRRFHWSCEAILANNGFDPKEFADKRFTEDENKIVTGNREGANK